MRYFNLYYSLFLGVPPTPTQHVLWPVYMFSHSHIISKWHSVSRGGRGEGRNRVSKKKMYSFLIFRLQLQSTLSASIVHFKDIGKHTQNANIHKMTIRSTSTIAAFTTAAADNNHNDDKLYYCLLFVIQCWDGFNNKYNSI